ncbi:MAG: acetyltransferase [Gammaproteobacteria bacterium]|jgi:hypothetical protein|nr:acetyltransferase [Gammaproteobacteria bacterium]
MFLKEYGGKHLIEVLGFDELIDPMKRSFTGRLNVGEEMPDADSFSKSKVCFPSGEALPKCWTDVHYRDDELRH